MSARPTVPEWFLAHQAWEHRDHIPDDVRLAVLDRDNWQCQLCGTGGENRLQLHHWFSFRSAGGPHVAPNLVTLCFRCHDDVHAGRQDILVLETAPGVWATFPGVPPRQHAPAPPAPPTTPTLKETT